MADIDGSPFVDVFGVSVELTIGDFLSIEGGFAISDGGNRIELTDGKLFAGQGPGFLEDGSINPAATGLALTLADRFREIPKHHDEGDHS